MGTDSEEDEDQIRMSGKNKLSNRRGRMGGKNENGLNDYQDEDDDFDHDGFMEQMLADMHSAQEEESIKQELAKKQ